MVAITAHFRTPSGEHWTLDDARGTTAKVHVRAKANVNPAAENGINYVEFSIDDGSVVTVQVALPTICLPNYSLEDSPATGRVGGHASFLGYELSLDLLTETKGTLTITATVFANSGADQEVPGEVLIFNDTDVNFGASDRRPSKKIIHVSRLTGTSGGTGAIGDKVDTPHHALALCRKNGNTDKEAGGARILIYDGMVGWQGGFGAPQWHTDSKWPVTVMPAGGVTSWEPSISGSQQPQDYIQGASGTNACLRIVGFDGVGSAQHFYNGGGGVTGEMRLDIIDCTHEGEWNDADPAPHVDFIVNSPGKPIAEVVGDGSAYYWGLAAEAFSYGLSGFESAHDVRLTKGIGIYMQPNPGMLDGPCATCVVGSGLRYRAGEVRGYVRHEVAADFTVTKPSGSVMRITIPLAAGVDIATHAQPLIQGTGADYWGVHVVGAWPGDAAGIFAVLGVGHDGSGNPYIDLDNPTATAGTPSSGAYIITGELNIVSGGVEREYPDAIHTDMVQFFSGPFTGMQLGDNRFFDMKHTRGYVGAGQTFTRCSIDFTCDSSPNTGFPDDLENDWQGATLTDCLFLGNSWRSSSNSFNGATISGGCMVDNSFGQMTNLVPGTMYVAHNHFSAGSTFGSNTSTGSWFAGNASQTPWSSLPASGNLNSASGLVDYPVAWRWPGATGDTKGCPRNIGTGDWSITGPAAIVPAFSGSGSLSVVLAGKGAVAPAFSAAGALSVVLAGKGAVVPSFSGSGSLSVVLGLSNGIFPAFSGSGSFACSLIAEEVIVYIIPELRNLPARPPRKPVFTWPVFKRRGKGSRLV